MSTGHAIKFSRKPRSKREDDTQRTRPEQLLAWLVCKEEMVGTQIQRTRPEQLFAWLVCKEEMVGTQIQRTRPEQLFTWLVCKEEMVRTQIPGLFGERESSPSGMRSPPDCFCVNSTGSINIAHFFIHPSGKLVVPLNHIPYSANQK